MAAAEAGGKRPAEAGPDGRPGWANGAAGREGLWTVGGRDGGETACGLGIVRGRVKRGEMRGRETQNGFGEPPQSRFALKFLSEEG